jgi:hypothetical protein
MFSSRPVAETALVVPGGESREENRIESSLDVGLSIAEN